MNALSARYAFFSFLAICLLACSDDPKPVPIAQPAVEGAPVVVEVPLKADSIAPPPISDTLTTAETSPPTTPVTTDSIPPKKNKPSLPEPKPSKTVGPLKGFSDIEALDKSILLDIRYATKNNFTKAQIYDCPKCYLRPEAAEAVVKAHKLLKTKGFGLKMYDCYRPRPYQQRLWDKVPDPNYVTPPAKGSMHGRGAAVDLTIVDSNGKELDMGTAYDFFGKEAHYDYTNLPEKVLSNRKMLRETLESVGFKGIRTEWWHFSYQGKDYPLAVDLWPCE